MAEVKIEIPAAPEILPPASKKQWQKRYEDGYKQGLLDSNGNEGDARIAATKYANQLLRVPEFTSYDEAMAAPAWMFLVRDEGTGKCVTVDGRKYGFDVPKPKATKAAEKPPAA